MSIDLDKLTPAPWELEPFDPDYGSGALYAKEHGRFIGVLGGDGANHTDAAFIALAREAFDVMMRRGWGVAILSTGWLPILPTMEPLVDLRMKRWPDPFTALLAADQWYKDNVEIKETK